MTVINQTNFQFNGQKEFYRGKVRDIYIFEEKMAMIATDRISAFDHILPQLIPYKGQVLTQISAFFMNMTKSIVPNWVEEYPHPNVAVGKKCQPYPIEMVIRGYLCGSAWRAYKNGMREMNGYTLPEGLKENDPLPTSIITPTTKAQNGHDMEISSKEIVSSGLMSSAELRQLESYTKILFRRGREYAQYQGLILADTKYEFGKYKGEIVLIDEIHTPDSSRYFNLEGYEERQEKGEAQPQRSKEMVRKWLMEQGFQGRKGEKIPNMSEEWIKAVSDEYVAIYEQITGEKLNKNENSYNLESLKQSIENLDTLH